MIFHHRAKNLCKPERSVNHVKTPIEFEHFRTLPDYVIQCTPDLVARYSHGIVCIFDAVLENKPFILNVYRCADREQVENYLYRLTYDLLDGVVEEKAAGLSVRPEDKAFLANFYKYAFVGLMLDWIRQGMSEDPAKIVERVSLVMHENIPRALTRLAVK